MKKVVNKSTLLSLSVSLTARQPCVVNEDYNAEPLVANIKKRLYLVVSQYNKEETGDDCDKGIIVALSTNKLE